jgi:hypothetical protein
MAKKSTEPSDSSEIVQILTNMLITQLGIAGVSQKNIRRIVGCDINRVNRIVKHIKTASRKEAD